MLVEVAVDALLDSIRLVPFLFLTYVCMEWLEHTTSNTVLTKVRNAGKTGPIWGAILGMLPQCGFSTAASSFYAGRVITVGTLLSIYLSTSDEMLPVLLAQAAPIGMIVKILAMKVCMGAITGLILEWFYEKFVQKEAEPLHIHEVCEKEHCHCEDGILISACKHTVRIFLYIVMIAFFLNALIQLIGEHRLEQCMSGMPVLGEMTAALVGLIPNCASSVVITQLYLDQLLSPGAMMSGLLCNAGVGILVLLRLNKNGKQNAKIIAALYGISVMWGWLISIMGITF